jgi:UDP-glucose:(heptosyl)LPS alpha-1,3-glucosyltransferase
MKIAFVVHDFLEGIGHGRYCIELARRFSRDHEIHAFANTFESTLDFRFQRHFVRASRATALTSVLTFASIAQKILDREHFDIVHAQGFACHRADIITAHVCNAARYKRDPAKTAHKKIFPRLVIPRERAFYKTAGAHEIIAVSKVIQTELRTEYGAASSVIYHGVDCAKFSPAPRTNKDQWLFAGEATKGLAETIGALAEFPNAHLTVVSRSDLSKFATSDRITFRGAVSDLPAIYREADLFVYPSKYDAFGLVVAEAMASGLPVIVGKDIGAAEWIVDGENGFLCDPSDLKSIVAAIRRATVSAEVGKKGRAAVLTHTWDRCAKETMALYERAISSKRINR